MKIFLTIYNANTNFFLITYNANTNFFLVHMCVAFAANKANTCFCVRPEPHKSTAILLTILLLK